MRKLLDKYITGIVDKVPQFRRGTVWCRKCGAVHLVDSGRALASGWPVCCGQTMTIDSPAEQQALDAVGRR